MNRRSFFATIAAICGARKLPSLAPVKHPSKIGDTLTVRKPTRFLLRPDGHYFRPDVIAGQ